MIGKKRKLLTTVLIFSLFTLLPGDVRDQKMYNFSGYKWIVKSSSADVGPGPNRFSTASAGIDSDILILKIKEKKKRWFSGEVYSEELFGYGSYTIDFFLEEELDSNAVFGFFLYNHELPPHYNEIDFEIARWGSPINPPLNWAVQPFDIPGNTKSFTADQRGHFRCTILWDFEKIIFSLSDSNGNNLDRWEYSGESLPVDTESRVHLNLWLFQGESPAGDGGLEIRIKAFEYKPLINR
ncbi:MAG: hypothetical protein PQJ50_01645 [Spirochaetales bacterium]|nr:hypothetical protein [Spirochaetales bacterium]